MTLDIEKAYKLKSEQHAKTLVELSQANVTIEDLRWRYNDLLKSVTRLECEVSDLNWRIANDA